MILTGTPLLIMPARAKPWPQNNKPVKAPAKKFFSEVGHDDPCWLDRCCLIYVLDSKFEETPLTGIQAGLAGNIRRHGVPFVVPVNACPSANPIAQHQSDISSKGLADRIL